MKKSISDKRKDGLEAERARDYSAGGIKRKLLDDLDSATSVPEIKVAVREALVYILNQV